MATASSVFPGTAFGSLDPITQQAAATSTGGGGTELTTPNSYGNLGLSPATLSLLRALEASHSTSSAPSISPSTEGGGQLQTAIPHTALPPALTQPPPSVTPLPGVSVPVPTPTGSSAGSPGSGVGGGVGGNPSSTGGAPGDPGGGTIGGLVGALGPPGIGTAIGMIANLALANPNLSQLSFVDLTNLVNQIANTAGLGGTPSDSGPGSSADSSGVSVGQPSADSGAASPSGDPGGGGDF